MSSLTMTSKTAIGKWDLAIRTTCTAETKLADSLERSLTISSRRSLRIDVILGIFDNDQLFTIYKLQMIFSFASFTSLLQ